MDSSLNRRRFIRATGTAALGLGLLGNRSLATQCCGPADSPFKISLGQWSIHRALRAGKIDPLGFPALASREFGIKAVEYVNQFYRETATDAGHFKELKTRADDAGVKSLLIMVDGEGNLGEPSGEARKKVVENHYKWIDSAFLLGCHSIRVNAAGPGDRAALADAVVDGLGRLSEYAAKADLNVLVENHGGFSSDASWLAGVIAAVGMDNCGTLPDFGNFCIRRETDADGQSVCLEEYDRYRGVAELMPFAKAVSAKSHDFDENGNETQTDFGRMMKIVRGAGYSGYVGIEYEGSRDDEFTGIRKTKALLERVAGKVAS